MSLRLYFSNRLETLAGKLAEELYDQAEFPLTKKKIIIQSRGMQQWLSLEISDLLGICTDIDFQFPNAFLTGLFERLPFEVINRSAFEPRLLKWKLMKIFKASLDDPVYSQLKNYIKVSDNELRQFQLASETAKLFDRYMIYRPELILDWGKRPGEHWQHKIWYEITKSIPEINQTVLREKFFEYYVNNPPSKTALPKEIFIFGISSLPRFYIDVIQFISSFTQVNVYLLNPCREYWGDIISKKSISKINRDKSAEKLHFEVGNPLLASWGIIGKEFIDSMINISDEQDECFQDSTGNSLLSHIQNQILNLNVESENGTKHILSDKDRSIQIHSCHNQIREIEILYDNLLHLFNEDSELNPKDIIVMAPDIESYSPLIQAVFDVFSHDPKRIPYRIADRNIRNEGKIIQGFFQILELTGSRITAPDVMRILEDASIEKKFKISQQDLAKIGTWVKDTNIRWGIDGSSRKDLDLPYYEENTWMNGLERMLLGYAMMDDNESLFENISPYNFIEGKDSSILGNFLHFLATLFRTLDLLSGTHPLKKWGEILTDILLSFFDSEENDEGEIYLIRNVFNQLKVPQEYFGFDETVDLNTIKYHLSSELSFDKSSGSFLSGQVTFCSMMPARSLPFKVVCLLGMDNHSYPRSEFQPDFDLMKNNRRHGDRSRRDDDKYIFLESILSARKYYYISYIGQSIIDNSVISPSVLVSELIDYIKNNYLDEKEEPVDDSTFIIKHRLQAFNPQYFKNKRGLISYSRENFEVAKKIISNTVSKKHFFENMLPEPEKDLFEININQLCSFFTAPQKYLLKTRIGIDFGKNLTLFDETEDFSLSGLELYKTRQDLLSCRFENKFTAKLYEYKKNKSELPPGRMGEIEFRRLAAESDAFINQLKDKQFDEGEIFEFSEVINQFTLYGQIEGIGNNKLLVYKYSKLSVKDYLKTWIKHLLLNTSRNSPVKKTSLVGLLDNSKSAVSIDMYNFDEVEKSKEILSELLELFSIGLSAPLKFIPEISWDFARRVFLKNEPEDQALSAAVRIIETGKYSGDGSLDEYGLLSFQNTDPFDAEFKKISLLVFKPLFASMSRA